jgi:nucleoside-diphosphate-sugar epimerase
MDDHRPAILLEATQAVWRWTHGYVDNVAQAIALAVLDDRAAGEVYNVGEEPTPTVSQRVQSLGRAAGWNGSIVSLDAKRLPVHLQAPYQPLQDLVVDSAKLRNELGYRERVSPEEALRRTIDWERSNPPTAGDPGAKEYDAEDAALR